MWPISVSSVSEKRLSKIFLPDRLATESGGDELFRSFSHNDVQVRAPLAQAADQFQDFIGGDAAADDEQDSLAVEHASVSKPSMMPAET